MRITAVLIGIMLLVILLAVFREALSGPVFRAEDHPDYEACLRAIPAEWLPGSMDRSGAEDACHYVHRR